MPRHSYLLFLTAVFCFFATFGFINDIRGMGRSTARDLALDVVLSGVTAIAWVVAVTRSRWFLVLAMPLFAFSIAREPGVPSTADVQRMQIDAVATAIGILFGYTCFTYFAATEGRRYLRVQTEMALARDIHATLAPPIERRVGEFEFFGVSVPSSDVGGDLVDLVGSEDRWMAYAADVSGHGVASGTLMAMFKSAARSQLMIRMDPQALLTDLNQVIFELKRSSMFITCRRSVRL